MSAPIPTPVVRDVRFGFTEDLPKYWYGGDPAVTALLNALSLLFPEGERFFVRSVKHFADQLNDPALAGPVKAFMGQEGKHSREHGALNELIGRQWGPEARAMEKRAAEMLQWVERRISPHRRLAITCALEHLTAIFAELVLEHPEILAPAHERMQALLRWHAGEEIEHKAVAFDVYEASGGTYALRVFTLLTETFLFFYFSHSIALRMLANDGQGRLASARKLARFMLVRPGILPKIALPWLQYFKPGFHPWQRDNRHLLAALE